MTIPRWTPSSEITKREAFLLERLKRTKKLFRFLREHRLELFDAAFQDELASMYRDGDEGKEPVAPAQLAMAILLQAYTGSSDAEAIENAVVDARWRMVLGTLGPDEEEPPFSQGTLQRFRQRMIAHDMDRRLLERTVELAKKTRGFDYKKLPKDVRLAVDSRPLTGAGKVEDTFNLLGHAARKLLKSAAAIVGMKPSEVADSIGAPALTASSTKRGLDIDWNDPEQKAGAIKKLAEQIDRLEAWVHEKLGDAAERPPLSEQLATLAQLREQDLEPDPEGGGPRIRDGVAPDRRISVEDPDMRHGRKSKSQTIKGFKTHLAADLDTNLIVACAVTPANKPEADALPAIVEDLGRWWRAETGLPLPLGANGVLRALDDRHGPGTMAEVAGLLARSIRHALDHRAESVRYAMKFAEGMTEELADEFISMYVNAWTLDFGPVGRRAVGTLLGRAADAGLLPRVREPDFVGGAP